MHMFKHSVLAIFMPLHVHGALSPSGLSHGSRPLRKSEAWGHDSMGSEPCWQQWASMGQEGATDRGCISFCPVEING